MKNDDLRAPFAAYAEERHPDASPLRVLQSLLLAVWCPETAHPQLRGAWTVLQPTVGQADVTAMLVHNAFGGIILEMTMQDGTLHFYNRIPDGKRIVTADMVRPELPEKRPGALFTTYRAMLTGWQSARAERGVRYDLLKRKIRERLADET